MRKFTEETKVRLTVEHKKMLKEIAEKECAPLAYILRQAILNYLREKGYA